jgi:trigger factor
MQVTTERLEDCQVKVIIELDAAEADKKLRQTAREISRQVNIPGYRRGKAPLAAVIRTFGREAIQEQVMEDIGQDLYEQALEEIEYEPYQTGALEEVEWDPFCMTVLLPIAPEVDLGDYRQVRVAYEPEPVTDEQVDSYLAELQQEQAQWVPVERPAALGDQVVVDMEGKAGDELIMSNEDHEMVLEAGATVPLPGFHEEIVGLSPGEEKSFVLVVPQEDADEEAAGQEATVTAKLHSVKEKEIPPLDDDFALTVGTYDTLEDLKAGVREELETEAEQRTESEYLDKALDAFIEAAVKIEYPPQAVDREADVALNEMERNLSMSGIQLDRYLVAMGKTREAYKQDLHPAAEERVRKRLVLYEIAKQEGLKVDPEAVQAEIERMIGDLGPDSDQVVQMLQSPEGYLMVADDLLMASVQTRATEIANGEAPSLEEDDAEGAEAETEEAAEEPEAEANVEGDAEAADEADEAEEAEAEEDTPEPPVEEEAQDSAEESQDEASS